MTKNESTLLMGAVAYDPKVVTIWNGFRDYFVDNDLDFDYILFSNYERQVEALFAGMIHVAWNSPLAWLQTVKLAEALGRKAHSICMRDSDCDLTSVVLVRADSPLNSVAALKGKRVAVGAKDSPQATLIPLNFLAGSGLQPRRDFELLRFELLVGLHGDHIGGERDAVQALISGDADAACILEANYAGFLSDGTLPVGYGRILARTPPFDHCNFTTLDEVTYPRIEQFRALLLGMSYSDPKLQQLLDMEGLKQWVPGRDSGYAELESAITRFGTVDEFVRSAQAKCG
jgi:ABC-type phosphate/phosphonate transport system substrate-binding protein